MHMFKDKGISGANDGDKARIAKDRLGMTLQKSEQSETRGKTYPDCCLNMSVISISIGMRIGIGNGIGNGKRNRS